MHLPLLSLYYNILHILISHHIVIRYFKTKGELGIRGFDYSDTRKKENDIEFDENECRWFGKLEVKKKKTQLDHRFLWNTAPPSKIPGGWMIRFPSIMVSLVMRPPL